MLLDHALQICSLDSLSIFLITSFIITCRFVSLCLSLICYVVRAAGFQFCIVNLKDCLSLSSLPHELASTARFFVGLARKPKRIACESSWSRASPWNGPSRPWWLRLVPPSPAWKGEQYVCGERPLFLAKPMNKVMSYWCHGDCGF